MDIRRHFVCYGLHDIPAETGPSRLYMLNFVTEAALALLPSSSFFHPLLCA